LVSRQRCEADEVARAGAQCLRRDWKFRSALGRAALRRDPRAAIGIGRVRRRNSCRACAMGAPPARIFWLFLEVPSEQRSALAICAGNYAPEVAIRMMAS